MNSSKNAVRASGSKYGPAVRIGIAVLVLHTVGWLGWKAVTQDAESKEAAAKAQQEQLRAVFAEK
ncbi:uncharacterized protein LOC26534523 [Drosophila yakuba]|uniref:Uncharacterized protein n=1 Tax=Drosophila yakuba TaxID=7245 RepID=A0A0R1DYY4_DROYA|nr:uncharacterized protein LOC26534523 [Drosophila yakuba]KRK00372.1 uncharacterized protein Dyak_GE27342 [Drosophila yakuba]